VTQANPNNNNNLPKPVSSGFLRPSALVRIPSQLMKKTGSFIEGRGNTLNKMSSFRMVKKKGSGSSFSSATSSFNDGGGGGGGGGGGDNDDDHDDVGGGVVVHRKLASAETQFQRTHGSIRETEYEEDDDDDEKASRGLKSNRQIHQHSTLGDIYTGGGGGGGVPQSPVHDKVGLRVDDDDDSDSDYGSSVESETNNEDISMEVRTSGTVAVAGIKFGVLKEHAAIDTTNDQHQQRFANTTENIMSFNNHVKKKEEEEEEEEKGQDQERSTLMGKNLSLEMQDMSPKRNSSSSGRNGHQDSDLSLSSSLSSSLSPRSPTSPTSSPFKVAARAVVNSQRPMKTLDWKEVGGGLSYIVCSLFFFFFHL
jgi:hypothetical protein